MTDRREHQCHVDGCDSQAAFTTRFLVDCCRPGERQTVRTHCTIKVCARHAVAGDVRRFVMSDRNREVIATTLSDAGYGDVDWLSAQVLFDPIEAGHHAMIKAAPPPMCDRGGCKKAARWQIKQLFRMLWQRGKGKPQVEVLTKMCVCDEHKVSTTARDFRDKASEASTRAWLNAKGVSMPDFETMQLGFVGLHGERINPHDWVGDNGPLDQFKDAKG